MPLAPSTLADQLESTFESPGGSYQECANQWASAVEAYAAAIVPPSLAISTAAQALAGALASAFAKPDAIPDMESAFTQFATAVAAGMLPTYTGTPPAGPVGFAPHFESAAPATHAVAASDIASLIDTWMKTGTAVLVAPPNTPLTWT